MQEVKLHVIKMTDAILRIRAPLVKLMEVTFYSAGKLCVH